MAYSQKNRNARRIQFFKQEKLQPSLYDLEYGMKLKNKKTGEVFEVCKRDYEKDLLGMGENVEGVTVKNKKGTHFFLFASRLKDWEFA